MSVRSAATLVGASVALAGLGSAGPAAAQSGTDRTVSAIGVGSMRPDPTDRRSNRAIRRAVEDARRETVGLALDAAEDRASLLAAAAGLTLGGLLAVEETVTALPWESDYATLGAFGPGVYCRRFRRPIVRRRDGRRHVVGHRTRRVCVVPDSVSTRVQVTYAAS